MAGWTRKRSSERIRITTLSRTDRISQLTDATCIDDSEGFTLVVGGEELSWTCEAHTYLMLKSAIISAVYAALSRQAGLLPESPEKVAGVLAGCENILVAGNFYRLDCIVTPLRLVFVDPCFGSWEEMSKGWFAEAPVNMKTLLSRFEQVTGTTWHGGAEQRVTSAVGDVPGTPWEGSYLRPVRLSLGQSRTPHDPCQRCRRGHHLSGRLPGRWALLHAESPG